MPPRRTYQSKTYLIDDNQVATTAQLAGKASTTDVDSRVLKTTTVNGHALSSNVTVSKSDVGLGNVDNTSDANAPVSTAQQTALNLKANLASPALTGSPTINGSSIPLGGSILSCPVNNTVLSTATGLVYASPGNDGTPLTITSEGAVSFPSPRAGTLRNLFVRTGTTAKVNTPATVVTVRVNGADTALTVTMTQTVSTTMSDITHSVIVAQGDLITVSLVTTGTLAVSTSIASISFELG